MASEKQIDQLTRLYQAGFGLVVAAADKYAPSPEDVDDITQQVYLDFLRGALDGKWKLDQDVGPLLYEMAKRRAHNLRREEKRKSSDFIRMIAERLDVDGEGYEDEAPGTLEHDMMMLRVLDECVQTLSPKSRAVLERHYYEGVSMKEIAGELKKRESAVYQFFFRLRAKLRECAERKTTEK